MKNDQAVIMYDSAEAAQYKANLNGWVSRNGRFFGGDEAAARYDGCTHKPCTTCGAPELRMWTLCGACRGTKKLAHYRAMPAVKWDGEAMLYSRLRNEFYDSPDHADNDLDDGETMEDLGLVICVPEYVTKLSAEDYCDALPDGAVLPADVTAAIDKFNAAVDGIVISWSPGKARLMLEDEG